MDLQAEVDELRARVRQLTKDVDSLEQTNREFGKGHLAEWTHQEQRLIAIEEKLKSLSLSEETVNAIVRVGQREINERIDQVVEIIGARIDTLDSQLMALAMRAGSLEADVAKLEQEPPFPTGGASTAEAAANAVLPVPQRGDRVRLEGAVNELGKVIPDGWYDVVGHSGGLDEPPSFQIEVPTAVVGARWMTWCYCDNSGLKEVRHADD